MENAVGDMVLRMSGNGRLAEICAQVAADIEDGSVCRRVESPGDAAVLAGAPGLVTAVADGADPDADAVATPFVFARGLLYTRRNWVYEQTVRRRIAAMAGAPPDGCAEVPAAGLYAGLRGEQRRAVEAMCTRRFTIISGGPGTGKTFTVARAVKFVEERSPGIRLALAAPTAKAAARMKEAIVGSPDAPGGGAGGLCGDVAVKAGTLHRLLEPNRDFVTFKRNRGNPLPLDWLIVDEASMIDLPLMAKLLDALPEACRLTLVGDVDQLASVERGHVLGDLCRAPGVCLCRLVESARFPAGGEIARLAAAVNENRPAEAMAQLEAGGEVVSFAAIPGSAAFAPERWDGFAELVREGFARFAASATAEEALAHVNDFRVLCALRSGPFGSERINEFIRSRLGARSPVPWMVTRNDRTLGVYNGDVGVVMDEGAGGGRYLNLAGAGGVRRIRVELLPSMEPAFASTVHKAQGSEYDRVAIVMPPDGDSPLLTRETLYTAITRTRGTVRIYAGPGSVEACCARRVERVSGML